MPATALALSVPLDVEFDGTSGDFGTLTVEEDAQTGGLLFTIALNTDVLGDGADTHYFYFNLTPDIDGETLALDSDPEESGVQTDYQLANAFPVRGGAGSSFDFAVFFGNGASSNGNWDLGTATFLITSDSRDLSIHHLLELSSTASGLETHVAVHVQNTDNGGGSTTLGATLTPEPGTFVLLSSGLIGLALCGGRRR